MTRFHPSPRTQIPPIGCDYCISTYSPDLSIDFTNIYKTAFFIFTEHVHMSYIKCSSAGISSALFMLLYDLYVAEDFCFCEGVSATWEARRLLGGGEVILETTSWLRAGLFWYHWLDGALDVGTWVIILNRCRGQTTSCCYFFTVVIQ